MSNSHREVLMIGLPKTGKTTYLAALWHVVNHPDEVLGALRLVCLDGDDEHLNNILARWLKYEEVGRTILGSEKRVAMTLAGEDGANKARVFFPDLSGERFRQQVESRQCDKEYPSQVEAASGALLFIHSGDILRPTRIDQVEALANAVSEDVSPEDEDQREYVPWDNSLAPTQVKAVELLQFVASLRKSGLPFPVAVVLSAWDLVANLSASPPEFLKNRLPLLEQYLGANDHLFGYSVYGVSAQGGRIDDEESRARLSQQTYAPASRIVVSTQDSTTNDLTLPIRWLTEQTDGPD